MRKQGITAKSSVFRHVATCVLFFGIAGSSNASDKLYGFDTGGPLTCSGASPSISCTDAGAKWEGWSYGSSNGLTGFYKDSNPSFRINWVDYDHTNGPDGGWLEVDDTKGAAGTSGSLKARVTSGPNNGGYINKKEDELNFPSRVGTGIGGNLYMEFFSTGRHYTELVGKDRVSVYVWIPPVWRHYGASYWGLDWIDHNFHVGTNVCPLRDDPCIVRPGCSPYSDGEPCNGASSHFYHHYTFGQWGGGGWARLIIDQYPQWERQNSWNSSYNPTQAKFGQDYVPSLSRMYLEFTGTPNDLSLVTPFEVWIDEMVGESTAADYAEPNQNKSSVASVALGYYPEGNGHWEISWSAGTNGSLGTYEVRYSLSEFTNANFSTNGNPITPLYSAASGGSGLVGKLVSDTGFYRYATYFDLPSEYEAPGTVVYFAIKDVSRAGQHGTNRVGPDQRNATESNIYAVSYQVAGGAATTARPTRHTGLGLQNRTP